jgi:hypothetical protein
MRHTVLPYLLVMCLLTVFAAEGYVYGLFGVLGVYGVMSLGLIVAAIGFVRRDVRKYGPPPRRRR